MKQRFSIFFILILLSACCKEYHCVKDGSIDMVLVNFSPTDLDSAVLFMYLKNNQFNTVLDTRKKPYLFLDTSKTIRLDNINYDYALALKTDTFYVSEITQKLTTFKSCFGAVPKMSSCEILDTYIIKGKNMTKKGTEITITK